MRQSYLVYLPLLAALGLVGCLSDSPKPDPYAGMTCDQKIAAIAQEIQKFQAAQLPAAKLSADTTQPDSTHPDSVKPDSTQPDSAKPDSARKVIQLFRAYPPVSGLTPTPPLDSNVIGNTDNRGGGIGGSNTGVQWIAPVGFTPTSPTPSTQPDTPGLTREATVPTVMPKSVSAVQIVSGSAYKAHVRVYDFRDELIREFRQEFGYQGELTNPNRMVTGGLVSFLVWDNKDASGGKVPSGVYLWRVRLEMESGPVREETTKIGIIGDECQPAP